MRVITFLTVVLIVVSLLQGCNPQSESQLIELKGEVGKLKLQVDTLQQRLADSQTQVSDLESQIKTTNELSEINEKSTDEQIAHINSIISQLQSDLGESTTTLDLADKTYSKIRTNSGPIFISVQHIEQYLDGSKVTLAIGNPSLTTLRGIKLSLSWNILFPEYKPGDKDFKAKGANWYNSLLHKEIIVNEEIRAGYWNKVECVLEKINPQRLGHLEISIESNKVSLLKYKDM